VCRVLEREVTGVGPQVRRTDESDTRAGRHRGRMWFYRLDPGIVSIGDFTQVTQNTFIAIERDNNQGAAAQIKRIYEVDLRRVGPDGTLEKTLVADLMHISDP